MELINKSSHPSLWKRFDQRVFAFMLSHSPAGRDDDLNTQSKRRLLDGARGNILEIGPGTGASLRYYPPGIEWTGVEPNPYMRPYLLASIRNLGWPAQRYHLETGDPNGINLPAADGTVDVVVSMHVLCSVPDPEASLKEILRVLKPEGRLVFLEHVAASPGSRLLRIQGMIQPIWSLVGDGCHLNRDTSRLLSQAGFSSVEIDRYQVPGAGPVSPHICGWAVK